jgi:hypothetical protein
MVGAGAGTGAPGPVSALAIGGAAPFGTAGVDKQPTQRQPGTAPAAHTTLEDSATRPNLLMVHVQRGAAQRPWLHWG